MVDGGKATYGSSSSGRVSIDDVCADRAIEGIDDAEWNIMGGRSEHLPLCSGCAVALLGVGKVRV